MNQAKLIISIVHVKSYQEEGTKEESYIRSFIYAFLFLAYPTLIFLIWDKSNDP